MVKKIRILSMMLGRVFTLMIPKVLIILIQVIIIGNNSNNSNTSNPDAYINPDVYSHDCLNLNNGKIPRNEEDRDLIDMIKANKT